MSKSKHPYVDFSFKCDQDWSKMEDRKNGKHCSSCKKNLIDFSLMSNLEAVQFLKNNKDQNVCGKMTSSQLEQLNTVVALQNQNNFSLKAILAGTAIGISTLTLAQDSLPVLHQNEMIKVELVNSTFNSDTLNANKIQGTVVDVDGEPIPFVSLLMPEGNQAVRTDMDGKFEFIYGDDFPGRIYIRDSHYGNDSSMIANEYANKEIRVVMQSAMELEILGIMLYTPPPKNWVNTRVRAFASFVRGRRE